MNTKMLREEFLSILNLEERARHFYEHYIGEVDDETIKKELVSIRDDEIGHIKIAKKLIEYVS